MVKLAKEMVLVIIVAAVAVCGLLVLVGNFGVDDISGQAIQVSKYTAKLQKPTTTQSSFKTSGAWDGIWITDWDSYVTTVELTQSGNSVTGTYKWQGSSGYIEGTVSGTVLEFKWWEGYNTYNQAKSNGGTYGTGEWTIDTSSTPYNINPGYYYIRAESNNYGVWVGYKSS